MSEINTRVYRERALKDKASIIELRQNAAFNGYFMRRVKEKMSESGQIMKHGESLEIRESARQSVLFYEEIERWFSDGEIASCDRVATTQ